MKMRSLKLLMALVLIVQTITFTSVFASEGRVITSIDFTESKVYDLTNAVADVRDNAVVYGAHGKGINDASLRMAINGSGSNQYIRYNPKLDLNSGEYLHIGFDYFREDYHSGIDAQISLKCASDAKLRHEVKLIDHPTTSSSWYNRVRLFNSSDKTKGFDDIPGQWHRYDVYLSSSDGTTIAFYDNQVYEVNMEKFGGDSYTGITHLDRLCIYHVGGKGPNSTPSATLLDNLVIETVLSIPETSSFKKMGEKFDFDDHMEVIKHKDGYGVYGSTYYNGTNDVLAQRYVGYQTQTQTSFHLTNDPDKYLKIESGVFGKPSFDKSAHFTATSDASDCDPIWYYPSVDDLGANETAHLTFSIANNTPDVRFRLRATSPVFVDDSTNSPVLFEMKPQDNKVFFFEQETQAQWEPYRWYKVDIVITNTADGNSIDCYLDGKLLLDDYTGWNTGKMLKDIDRLYFDKDDNADYYVDDIFYGRRFENATYDPTFGYSLTDTNETFINNEEKIIAINSDASVADFKNLLNEKNNVTVFDNAGYIINKGSLNSASTVKVSNGFGGGVYYNVGYKSDKLAIGDIVFDSDAQTLKSQAEVGFGIREDYDAPVVPYPTSGTVIIALYEGNELVACTPVPYSNLTEADPVEAVIRNVESIEGKTVKVFIWDNTDSITPLIVNKEK